MDRFLKQLFYGLFYVLFFGLVSYGLVAFFRIEPTCFDHIQNGGEEGLDCGVSACGTLCAPLAMPVQVKSTTLIRASSGYDFVAQVTNPNIALGAADITYKLEFQSGGTTVDSRQGTFYLLPGQTRYIVLTALQLTGSPTTAQLTVVEPPWQKADFAKTQVDFPIRKEQYTDRAGQGALYQVTLYNDSVYDLDTVEVTVILRNDQGEVVGVNQTTVNSFLAKTERAIQVQWPFEISSRSPQVEVQAISNVLKNTNFIKTYGAPSPQESQNSSQNRPPLS